MTVVSKAIRNATTHNGQGERQGVLFARMVMALFTIALVGLPFTGTVLAQSDPSTRVFQQTEDRAQELGNEGDVEQQGDPVIFDPVPRADLPAPGGQTVTLMGVQFEPDSAFISEDELAALAAPYIGRPIDFSGIANLVRDVNDVYAERGIVTASAILPPQNLDSGILNIQLVEGRLGNLAIVGERQTSNDYILDRITVANEDGIVDIPTAAQDITFYNRTNLAQLRLLLQPGSGFGLTDLALGITEPPRDQLIAFIDNQGVQSTGEVVTGVSWQHYGALGIDDSLLVFASASEGSIAGTINYDIPVSTFGTRLSLGATASRTRVVDGPTVDLNITGASRAFTGTLSQSLVADSHWLLKATASFQRGFSQSQSEDVPLVDMETNQVAVGLPLEYSDETKSFTIQPRIIFANVEDMLSGTTRPVTLFAASASGIVDINDTFNLQTRGAMQYSAEQLLPGNLLFQIGGPTTVRGYPSDGVGGDSGYFIQAELHWNLRESVEGLDVFAFTDVGEVFSTFPDRTTLLSTGVGLSYAFHERAGLEVTAGVPLLESMDNQADFAVTARLTSQIF